MELVEPGIGTGILEQDVTLRVIPIAIISMTIC